MADIPRILSRTIVFLVALTTLAHSQRDGDRCIFLSDGSIGVCHQVRECFQFVRKQVTDGIRPTICNARDKLVCCERPNHQYQPQSYGFETATPVTKRPPTSPPRRQQWGDDGKRISERMCDEYSKPVTQVIETLPLLVDAVPLSHTVAKCTYNQSPLIVGGEEATLGEFPHMAAVGFPSDGGRYKWNCGGTLISDRYVVTAAHCAYDRTYDLEPSVVRLGAHDLKMTESESAENYDISHVSVHPEYKKPYHDIALLKLRKSVRFTDSVRPACLWQHNEIKDANAIATGWGDTAYRGKSSSVLLKVVLNVLDNQVCQRIVQAKGKRFKHILDEQLCTGGTRDKKDTCQGDSGGPLIVKKSDNTCIAYIIGVTSFGRTCADGFPGIYTRISSYIPWIESIVWPN